MATVDHKPTPTERLYAALMASIARSHGGEDYEIGESAQGRAYVKSVHVNREPGEPLEAWAQRGLDVLSLLKAGLPAVAPESPSVDELAPKRRSRKPVAP